MSGVDFRSISGYTGAPDVVIPADAGVANGDFLIAQVMTQEVIRGDGATITQPGGFTPIFGGPGYYTFDTGAGLRQFWWVGWKIAASEPASYTFPIGSSNPAVHALIDCAGQVAAYSNPDATTPILAVGGPTTTFGSTIDFAGVVPGAADSLIVNLFAVLPLDTGFSPPDDEVVDAVDDAYSTPNATLLTVPAPGVLGNDSYDPGHQPIIDRGSVTQAPGGTSMTLDVTDYPWHPATDTGPLTYFSVGIDVLGSISFALKGSDRLQATPADLVLTTFGTAPPGTLVLNGDGSFTYDPSSFGVESYQYQWTSPSTKFDRATVRITIGYPPVVFADAILRSETSAGATGSPTSDPVFAGDTLFKAEG